MTRVTLDHLTRQFGSSAAVQDLCLEAEPGEMVALLGPSGCGKTTTLRMIAGLLEPTSGDVLFDGRSVAPVPAEKRGAVMVFQKHLLFPTMSVAGNVGFGLRMQGVSKAEIDRKVTEMLELVRLEGMGDRRGHELSGGQQQRVALARALIVRPRVLLLDEPLANLDANLRVEMGELIRSIHTETGITSIVVTHDQEEAVMLADRVALMLSGVLQQYGSPSDLYERPLSVQVARFFRNENFLPGVREGSRVDTAVGRLVIDPDRVEPHRGGVLVTVRPEHLEICDGSATYDNLVEARILASIYLGNRRRLVVSFGGVEWHVETSDEASLVEGATVKLRLSPERIWLLRGDVSGDAQSTA